MKHINVAKLEILKHSAICRRLVQMLKRHSSVQSSGCITWTGAKRKGYGMLQIQIEHNRYTFTAHRIAWELEHGPLTSDQVVDHLCRVKNCIRVDHLEAVSAKENVLRGIGPTARHARLTHCPNGHPYSGENLYRNPDGDRRCRTCRTEYRKAYRLAHGC